MWLNFQDPEYLILGMTILEYNCQYSVICNFKLNLTNIYKNTF